MLFLVVFLNVCAKHELRDFAHARHAAELRHPCSTAGRVLGLRVGDIMRNVPRAAELVWSCSSGDFPGLRPSNHMPDGFRAFASMGQ
eukprot:CAMPEP_0176116622 /NCGR_PEP_ID=MMETSP0120_2-20121206/58579_1 /TAXON_ID=160619 /ORGANISM="Kryptoperidinium foliaceum, Strain CCMP 1326" /LENGTH=86 /DNA_ID=CAMNT_0017450891 /DNA_START=123 /DNA_END=383 /DNA_ORIENTATION=+